MIHAAFLSVAMSVFGSAIGSTPAGDIEGLYSHLYHAKKLQPLPLQHRESTISVHSFISCSGWGPTTIHVAASFNYERDIEHWASSSTQIAACSFEPGRVEDVGVAVSTFFSN